MKKLVEVASEFFQEDNGGFSMSRLLCFLAVALPLLVWSALCLYHLAMQPYPSDAAAVQLGGLAAKPLMKMTESKGVPPPPEG